MRYRSESRYNPGAVANLFSRAPIVTPPFYRGSVFVSGGACKTNGVASQRNPSRPFFLARPHFSISSPLVSFRSFPLSTYLLTYLLTFHARKPDVYYRACLAISVLSSSSLPPLFARKTPEQGVPFLKLPFADTPVSPVSRGVSCKRCYRPPRWKRRDAVET